MSLLIKFTFYGVLVSVETEARRQDDWEDSETTLNECSKGETKHSLRIDNHCKVNETDFTDT